MTANRKLTTIKHHLGRIPETLLWFRKVLAGVAELTAPMQFLTQFDFNLKAGPLSHSHSVLNLCYDLALLHFVLFLFLLESIGCVLSI